MELSHAHLRIGASDVKSDLKQRMINRLHWIHVMRWFAVGVACIAMLSAWFLYRLPLHYAALASSVLLLAIFNVTFTYAGRRFDHETTPMWKFNRLIYSEISVDFILLACMIHLTGGISNFFAFYYVLHIVIGNLLVPRKVGYFMAAMGTLLVGAVAILEMKGILPHYSLGSFAPDNAYAEPGYVFHYMIILSGLLFAMSYVASTLSMMIYRRERYLTELKEKLEVWNRQMRLANDRLIEIDRTKTQFMRLSGHEIRSPLSAMLSIMRTILEGYVKEEGKILEMIGLANRRANEALEITNKLLQLAREKGKDLEPESFDMIAETIAEIKEIGPLAEKHFVSVDLEPPTADSILVHVDRESFRLAVQNLLSNAIIYSNPESRVTVHLEKWHDKGMVIIVDRGIGIPEEFMPGIYDEFSRARNARKHDHSGTGLGMSITRQAAVNIGGSITVRSISLQGTVARLTVPLRKNESSVDDSEAQQQLA